ncbi:glutathione S-transferase family protein [Methylococcus sp. Mc7]|uniref:glutathione S-transferase family protein n=1 Tax=Methylococcus sp. Mc7 TaxID=2860258 RepID=UPI001C52B233|nr:glutathione S-transferase [Methylococcus sp. Mc7]QXP85599.1 glutathione S-transferase [Methylococcus sp. Mc7]
MNADRHLTLFHAPHSRSTGTLMLLEELGADYELRILNLKTGEQHEPAYLAVNPMGKVPALKHGEAVVTEQVAIYLYLADLYPEAGLGPPIGDALRGPYLRWLAFYGCSFEPALIDRAQQREAPPRQMSPYGDYETVLKTLTDQLSRGPYLLGEKFSAADVLWGTALDWTVKFGLVPALPAIQAYIDRANAREATVKVRALDAELAAAQG